MRTDLSLYPRSPSRLLWTSLFLVFCSAAYFIAKDALPYLYQFSPAAYGPFWTNRAWLLPHVAGGVLALTIGAAQLCLGFSRRTGRWHRYLGRSYAVVVLVSAAAAAMMVARGSVVGSAFGAILASAAVIWCVVTIMGWLAAQRRQWHAHRDWMIRSYAVALAFVLFRLLVELPLLTALSFQDRYTALIGVTFFAILAGIEIILQWRRTFGASVREGGAQLSSVSVG